MLFAQRCRNLVFFLIIALTLPSLGTAMEKASKLKAPSRGPSSGALSCMSAAIQKLIAKQYRGPNADLDREIIRAELKRTTPTSRVYTIHVHVTDDDGIEKDETAEVEVGVVGKDGSVRTCR